MHSFSILISANLGAICVICATLSYWRFSYWGACASQKVLQSLKLDSALSVDSSLILEGLGHRPKKRRIGWVGPENVTAVTI